jgi:hypothetical protein
MKRGIPIALRAAGMLLACLVTSLNHPVAANATTVSLRDTAYYFNEKGVQIYCDTNAAARGNFIIKTSKSYLEMFPDWEERDTTKSSGTYRPAAVNGIPRSTANLVEALIRRRSLDNPMVEKNVVPILDKGSIRKMLDTIRATYKVTKRKKKFREYGGLINRDTTFTCQRGKPTNPRDPENEGLEMNLGVIGNYHSHPDGYDVETIRGRDPFGHDKVSFSDSTITRMYHFIQGPSNKDQYFIKDKAGYVFGMASELVYLFDKSGVVATLPFRSLLPSTVKK